MIRASAENSVSNIDFEIRPTFEYPIFNIFLCDLFYMMSDTDFASYADDNTPCVSADTIDEVIKRLETASVKLFKRFAHNQMKANQDKCHLIISKNENVSM